MLDHNYELPELIQRIAEDYRNAERLSESSLSSVVTKILSADTHWLEVSRQFSKQADLLISIEDHLGGLERVAVEFKALQASVDTAAVRELYEATKALQANRGILVTTATFTDQARQLAKSFAPTLQLVDHFTLSDWAKSYQTQLEAFAAALAFRIRDLPLREVATIPETSLDAVTAVHASASLIVQPFREPLMRVDRLPFKVLRAVMADPRHLHRLTPRQFEEFTAEILDALGFRDILLTPRSGDGGRDVIASREIHGIPLTFYFECKKYAEDNKVQLDSLRALLGVVAHNATEANIGVLVTTSTFTAGARKLIMSESRLDGKDYNGILGWVTSAKNRIREV